MCKNSSRGCLLPIGFFVAWPRWRYVEGHELCWQPYNGQEGGWGNMRQSHCLGICVCAYLLTLRVQTTIYISTYILISYNPPAFCENKMILHQPIHEALLFAIPYLIYRVSQKKCTNRTKSQPKSSAVGLNFTMDMIWGHLILLILVRDTFQAQAVPTTGD